MNKWTDYFLDMAKHASTLSKDPSTKIGAVAVGDKNQILSTGFNGFPRGIKDTDDRLYDKETKYSFMVHGEMNAIFNACYNGVSLDGATLYVYGLPVCADCANGIIQVGIKKVIAKYPKNISQKWRDSRKITINKFKEAGVVFVCYEETE